MSFIETITQQIEENLKGDRPPFKGTPLDDDRYREFVGSIFNPANLVLGEAHLETAEDSVYLTGSANLLGFRGLSFEFGFKSIAGACFFVMRANLPEFKPFSRLKPLRSPIDAPTLDWQYGPLSVNDASFALPATSHVLFYGTLQISKNLRLPVVVQPPIGQGLWTLRGNFEKSVNSALDSIINWIGVPVGRIPPAIRQGLDLDIADLNLTFDPDKSRVESAAITLTAAEPWQLVGNKLVLSSVALTLGFSRSEDGSMLPAAFVNGTLTLGKQEVSVHVGTADGVTYLDLLADGFHLPSLEELNTVVAEEFLKALPANLRSAKNILIRALRLEIAANKLRLARVEMAFGNVISIAGGIELENVDLVFEVRPQAKGTSKQVSARMSALMAIGDTFISVRGELDEIFTLQGSVTQLPITQLTTKLLPEFPNNFPQLILNNVGFAVTSEGVIDVAAAVTLNVARAAAELGIPLPHGIAEIELKTLAAHIDKSGWSLTVRTDQSFAFPPGATQDVKMSNIALNVSNGNFGFAFHLAGDISPVKEVQLHLPKLEASYQTESGWNVHGEASGQLFGLKIEGCQASIHDSVFRLTYPHSVPIVSFGAAGAADIKSFSLFVSQGKDKNAKTEWGFGVEGQGNLRLGAQSKPLLKTDFDIQIEDTQKTKRLVLRSEKPDPLSIPLGFPALKPPRLELALEKIAIETDVKSGTWIFQTHAAGQLLNLPEAVEDFLPSKLPKGDLVVSDTGIAFTCELNLTPDFKFFSAEVDGRTVRPRVHIPSLGIRLGDEPTITSHLIVELPYELNYFFGANQKGKPNLEFLNDSVELGLVLGNDLKLALVNNSSPLKGLNLRTDADGYTWGEWTFKNFGTFKLQVPELKFDGKAWMAGTGVDLPTPLKLPLTPLKFVIARLGGERLLEFIPDAVTIREMDLSKPAQTLQAIVGEKIVAARKKELQPFFNMLKEGEKALHRFPEAFDDYLKVKPIKRLQVSLGMEPSGRMTVGLEADPPVQFMLPWLASLPPELAGFQLRHLSVGQFGGLTLAKIDGHVDRFDLVTLVLAGTGVIERKEARQLTNRFTFGNVMAVVPAAFPIPIPLLYDTLRWDYKNWLGLALIADWHLKEKVDLLTLLASVINFFTDPTYELHRDTSRKDIALDLTVGPNYLTLPNFLKGKTIGFRGSLHIDLAYSIMLALDALKKRNAGYLIKALPLRNPQTQEWIRIGKKGAEVAFGPLSFSAGIGWCITTEDEFKEKILGNTEAETILGKIDADKVLATLPRDIGPAYEKGFVILLMGEVDLAKIMGCSTHFGLAVTGSGGLETAFLMEGYTGPLALSLGGGIRVSQKDNATTISGHCALTFKPADTEYILIEFGGDIKVTKYSFELYTKLSLGVCVLEGTFYIGSDQVYVCGQFNWDYGGTRPIVGEKIYASFHPEGIHVGVGAVNLFKTDCDLSVDLNTTNGDLKAVAKLDVNRLTQDFRNALIKRLNDVVNHELPEAEKAADAALGALSENVHSLYDLRNALLGELPILRTKTIPKKVDQIVNKVVKDWVDDSNKGKGKYDPRRIPGRVRKKAQETGRNKAKKDKTYQSWIGHVRTLENALKSVSNDPRKRDEQTRQILATALHTVISIKRLDIPVSIGVKPFFNRTFTFRVPDPIGEMRDSLVKAQSLVKNLPSRWSDEDSTKAAQRIKLEIKNALTQIEAAIKDHAKKNIPIIDWIDIDLPLTELHPDSIHADAQITYQGNPYQIVADINLNDIGRSLAAVTRAFTGQLAK